MGKVVSILRSVPGSRGQYTGRLSRRGDRRNRERDFPEHDRMPARLQRRSTDYAVQLQIALTRAHWDPQTADDVLRLLRRGCASSQEKLESSAHDLVMWEAKDSPLRARMLVEVLLHGSYATKMEAVRQLVQMRRRDPGLVTVLLAKLTDREHIAHEFVAYALGCPKAIPARERLLELMKSADAALARQACIAVARIGGAGTAEALRQAARDERQFVSGGAEIGLRIQAAAK